MIMNGATQSAQQKWQALLANKLAKLEFLVRILVLGILVFGILVLGVRGYLSPGNSRIPCRILTIQNSQNFVQEFQIIGILDYRNSRLQEFQNSQLKTSLYQFLFLRSSCGFFIYSLKSSFISSSFWFCIIQINECFWSLYFFKIRYIFLKNMLKLQIFLGG